MLPDDIALQVVKEIIPSKGRVAGSVGTENKQGQGSKNEMLLSEVVKKYVAEKESGWTAKSKMEFKSVFKLLQDILGDVDITSITKPMVTTLRTTLLKLPPNIYKKYPGQTIQQILTVKDLVPMSTKSVNKHISRLGALLIYCLDEGMITTNPASGLKIVEKKRADEERNAYSEEDIKNIVSKLPLMPSKPERYWIPFIGMYSGMRLNEICQLYVSDIINFDGLWCFSVNADKDKRLKNDASERVIPIHPKLIELGLIKYVEGLKADNVPRLWMNLEWTELTGYGNSFCKWYQRFNRLHITSDPKKVFHSFRHTVTDTLKQASIIETVIAELVGHSNGDSETMGRYGKRYQPKVLLEALLKLDYEVKLPVYALSH
jgi:integrase